MSLRMIPEGAVIEETYLAVPGHYGFPLARFPNTADGWDEAVTYAQQKKADLVASLTESLGKFATPEQVEEAANVQVRIDLRWKVRDDKGYTDTVVESYKDVDRLLTGGLKRPHVDRSSLGVTR